MNGSPNETDLKFAIMLIIHWQQAFDQTIFDLLKNKLDSKLCGEFQLRMSVDIDSHCDVLINGFPTQQSIESSGGSNLRYLLIPFTGYHPTTAAVMKGYPNVRVHNLHYASAFIAENAFALLLACSKLLIQKDSAMRKDGKWIPGYFSSKSASVDKESDDDRALREAFGAPTISLVGKTCLIIGFGAIGQQVKLIVC
jgi:lactate dehydrogenase-like 2-hydroxyacid dehydrogenase